MFVAHEQWPKTREISQGAFVLWLFVLMATLATLAGSLCWGLAYFYPITGHSTQFKFPLTFLLSTGLLIGNAFALHRSLSFVRRERQVAFRRWLLGGIGLGVLFLGFQGYGLLWLLRVQQPQNAQTGPHAFAFVLAFLHALHVIVAMMFLAFVLLRGLTDRYDHEYYWGVTCCVFFWDALGIVWLGILAVFSIAL